MRTEMRISPAGLKIVMFFVLPAVALVVTQAATPAQSPVTLTIRNLRNSGSAVPDDFVGLSFETGSELPNRNGVSGYLFCATNSQLITLTLINKEHGRKARDASVTINAKELAGAMAADMFLSASKSDPEKSAGVTLGGAIITNNAPWLGEWTKLGPMTKGQCVLRVPATSAVIVRLLPYVPK